jgi:hypothetical protein
MKQHKRAHKWAFPVGVILVLLAVVGAVSLVRLAAGGIQNQLTPKDKARYEEFLANIIAHDPDPFDSPDRADDISQLIDICIWSLTQSDDAKPGDYPMDDDGNLLIGQKIVAQEYKRLFGTEPPSFVSVEGSEFDFIYDADKERYLVPVTGMMSMYAPRVTDIKKTGSSVELTVDYLSYNDFTVDKQGYPVADKPAKIMIITLYEQPDSSLQVGSIRQPSGIEAAVGETKIG